MVKNQEKKASMDGKLIMAHIYSLFLIPFIFPFDILGLSDIRIAVLTIFLLTLYFSFTGNQRARLIWFGLICFFVYKSFLILSSFVSRGIAESSMDYIINIVAIAFFVFCPISLFVFVVSILHFKNEKKQYFFQDEGMKKYLSSFFLASFFLIILWLYRIASKYTCIQLILHMDALVLPLFPITA